MADPSSEPRRIIPKNQSRIPETSTFFTKVVPVIFIGMAIAMVGLILFAAGVLLGFIAF